MLCINVFPKFPQKLKYRFCTFPALHAGILFKNHKINASVSFGTCNVTGTVSLCTSALKKSAAGRTGAPLRSTDKRKAASRQTENQLSRLRRRQNQSATAAEATSWEKTDFPMKYMNAPKYDEPMPPYLGVFRIGSKKWQPHEFLAKFLAFADFWRRLKTSHAFSYKTANFRHIYDSAAQAPHRST